MASSCFSCMASAGGGRNGARRPAFFAGHNQPPRGEPRGAFDTLVASMRALHRESHLKTIEASVAQDLAAPIEEIRAPTLVIGSTHDTLYPRHIAEDMARRIPGARLVIIEEAGHLSNLDRPQEFNRALGEFLREHSLK